jgi:hypothetical protein
MNRRGKRIAFTVAATGLAVVLVLAIVHWGTVRDHVGAWRFQLTTETITMEPRTEALALWASEREDPGKLGLEFWELCDMLAGYSNVPVVFASIEAKTIFLLGGRWTLAAADSLQILKENRWRVLDQRLPQRAYVVIRDETLSKDLIIREGRRP